MTRDMASMIDFVRPDGERTPAYFAPAPGDAPGIVLIQEWWGLKPHILKLAERFAAAGYSTIAPDLYRGRIAASADEASHMMNGLDFVDACDQDLAGAERFLRAHGCPRVGVVGFCMGGALTIAAAVRLRGFDAASCFYGIPPKELADPAKIDIPLQGHFADKDDWCTPAAVDALQVQLRIPAEFHRYDADHAFFNESRPEVYDAAAAEKAWQRTLDFFERHLK